MKKTLTLISILLACGCSSSTRRGGGGGDAGGLHNGGDAGNTMQEGDGGTTQQDDGGSCTIDQPQSAPLPLPDTNASDGTQKPCTTDADCGGITPHCVITADKDPGDGGPGFCVASYVDTLNFVGFAAGATLTDTSKLISVCAKLEHSWFGDLQIEMISPDGKTVALRQFIGRDLNTFFLGHPNYCDSDASPMAGTGYQYCWTASAPSKILKQDASSVDGWTCAAPGGCESWNGGSVSSSCSQTMPDGPPPFRVIPAGNYKPDVDFSALQGAQLNGKWTFRITDLWQVDNGYLFDWSIQFDSSLVANCSTIIQ